MPSRGAVTAPTGALRVVHPCRPRRDDATATSPEEARPAVAAVGPAAPQGLWHRWGRLGPVLSGLPGALTSSADASVPPPPRGRTAPRVACLSSVMAFVCPRAAEPRPARAGCIATDEGCPCGRERTDAWIEVTWAGAHRASRDDRSGVGLRDRGHGQGRCVAIPADGKRARLGHGCPPSMVQVAT
jgi:hypothetical protein